MKKRALTAIASIALPLSALPMSAAATPEPAVSGAGTPPASDAIMALLSMDDYRAGAARVRAASASSIRPARIAIVPPPVAIDAPAPKPAVKPAKKTAAPRGKKKAASRSASVSAPATHAGGGSSTIASWYNDRPAACWDKRGRHGFPRGLSVWTAHKTLPCGTAVSVSGPAGTMTVRVYDRGPYVKGRSLDLSAAAFRGVCGSTSRGLCRVTYRVAA